MSMSILPPSTEASRPAPLRARGRPRGARTKLLNQASGPIGRHHFAFLRALLDGISLEQAWRSYLAFSGRPDDRRQAVAQLRQLVQVLGRAGGHAGCAAARTVVMPALRALPDLARRPPRPGAGIPGHRPADSAAPPTPTLDDWRASQCRSAGIDEDFYTEAEWLALHADAFGTGQAGAGIPGQWGASPSPALSATSHVWLAELAADAAAPGPSAVQRRALLDALATLEQALARDAAAGDATSLWLAGLLPRQLASVGVRTLGELVQFINLQGFRWHRRVPGLGVVRAQRLLA